MIFSSASFFFFFLAYFSIHVFLAARYRLFLIIAGSTFFYAWWKLEYTWIPFLLMAVAFYGSAWMDSGESETQRRLRAAVSVAVLFIPLIVLKYLDFLYHDVLGLVLRSGGLPFSIPLPLGISFITFTLTAYIVDVYRRQFPAGTPGPLLLGYVLFFPHLIAGPILRPAELIPQLRRPRWVSWRGFRVALAVFTLGLVKKILFADQIGEAVTQIYGQAASIDSWTALLAFYGFSAQIYCDFSAYTDMAIAIALMLGVRLPNNFARPYSAASLTQFWRRWHITLSTWLRDYLYIPLGGSRHGRWLTMRNLLITMLLGGLWHGANWTFAIWGLLHGFGLCALHLLRDIGKHVRLPHIEPWLGILLTFHFVTLTWVFFRARSVDQAVAMLNSLFTGGLSTPQTLVPYAFPVLLTLTGLALHRFDDHRRVKAAARRLRPEVFWSVIAAGWLVAITVSQGSSAAFIYFEF